MILTQAAKLISEDRPSTYGDAKINLRCVAELWAVYQMHNSGRSGGHDAAMFQVIVKIARIATGTYHADNYIDLAGYAALAGELGNGNL